MMRTIAPALLAVLTLSTGCQWMRNNRVEPRPNTPFAGTMPERTAPELVGYLNRQASYIQSISYDDVRAVAYENGKELGNLNSSSIDSVKPRSFRMNGGHSIVGKMIDIGSNEQEFWMWMSPKISGKDNYFYCSHQDFNSGRAKFPIPFDTDWVMMALGMTEYGTNPNDEVRVSKERGQYALVQQTKTAAGLPVLKSTVFAADWGNSSKPVVQKHVIFDIRETNKAIAIAEIVAVKPMTVAGGAVVQVPTEVILEWPQQNFRMTMKLAGERVNEVPSAEQAAKLFTKPRTGNPIDLARYQIVEPSSFRGQTSDSKKTYRLPTWPRN
jgi:hypothetical protein